MSHLAAPEAIRVKANLTNSILWSRKGIIEPLEQRIVLATFTWAIAGSGAWETAANWQLTGGTDADGIPDADDDVVIDASGTAVVTVSSVRGANSLTVVGDDQIRLTSGSLTLTAASSASSLQVTGGSIVANGLLTLTGDSAISGNSGIVGTIRNEGVLTVTGDPDLRAVVDNAGTVLLNGQIDIYNTGQINNLTGGVFEIAGNTNGVYLNHIGGSPGFFNSGIFRHSGTGTANISSTPFNNLPGGVIEVPAGTLAIGSGGTWEGGVMTVASGASLHLNGGTKTWTGTFAGSVGGEIFLSAGTITAGEGGATLKFPVGLFTITGNSLLSGGAFRNEGTLQVTGDPDLRVTVDNVGTLLLNGQFDVFDTGRINNLPGGVFDITGSTNGVYLNHIGGSQGVFNSGIFRHSGTGTANVSSTPFNNLPGGVIEVPTGALAIGSGGTWQGGAMTVAPEASLHLNGGTKTWTGTFTGSGGGNIHLSAGTITAGAGGATLDFPVGLFAISGNPALLGEAFRNEGTLQVGGDPDLRATIDNAGTVLLTGQFDVFNTGRINNLSGGVFDITGAPNGVYLNHIGGSVGFFNSGTFRHSGAGVANVSSTPFNNLPGGLIEVPAGTLAIGSGGTWEGAVMNVSPGAALHLNGGAKIWTDAFTGASGGEILLNAGSISAGEGGATLDFPAGLFTITGNPGLLGGTFRNVGTLQVAGDSDLRATLNNAGTVLLTGQIDIYDTGRINNLAGGVFDITGNTNGVYLNHVGGSLGVFNSGIFRHSGTGNANVTSTPFNNLPGGVIDVPAGVLAIGAGGTWQGAMINVADGATLHLNGGTKTWTGTFTGSGEGDVILNAGTIVAAPGGATLNFPEGLFGVSGNPALAGAAFTNVGTLTFAGDSDLRATINNAGTVLVTGQIDIYNTGQINNLAEGTFDITGSTNGVYLNHVGGSLGFFNSGIFRHSGTGDANVSSTPFNNLPGGVIDVPAGSLAIGSGGTWQGSVMNVAGGAALHLNGGTKTWTGIFTGSGGGNIHLSAGAVAGGVGGATLNFPLGLFVISGNPALIGEAFRNEGTLQIAGDSDLRTTLSNAGTVLLTGQVDVFNTGRINNLEGALFEIQSASNGVYLNHVGGSLGFFNSGVLRKSGVANATTSSLPMSNAGVVEVVSGTLTMANLPQLSAGTLSGGTWRVLGGAALNLPAGVTTNAATIILDGANAGFAQLNGLANNGGTLSLLNGANLTRAGALTNSGEIVISPQSVFTITGNFTHTADGRLEVQLAGGAASGDFGRIAITGSASLAGTLAVDTAGNFGPAAGESYTLMTFASRTGSFDAFEGFDQAYNPVFEFVADPDRIRLNSLIAAPDTAVTSIAAPTAGFVGNEVTITYTVSNLSDRPSTVTDWTDVIYLSRDGVLDASDYLVARVPHTGGLGALASYTEEITARLPGALEGEYQILVVTDNRRVAPDLDRSNNQLIAPEKITIDFAELALGTPTTGTIVHGQDVFFRIDLESGRDVFFTGNFEMPASAEFLVRYKAIPDRVTYDFSASSILELEQQIRLLNPRGGAYYVMLHGREGAAADGVDFTILADGAPFAIDAVGQTFGANVGKVTIPLAGAGFTPNLAVELRADGNGPVLAAQKVEVMNAYEAFATFDLTGLPTGAFDVVGVQGDTERFLNDAFEVREGEAGRLEARLTVPELVRMTRPYTITVEFENRGGTDIPTPLLIVEASGNNFLWAEGQTESQKTSTLQFLAVDQDGLSGGVLRPGEKHVVTLNAVTNGNAAKFTLSSTSGDSTELVNYSSLRSSMKIDGEPARYGQAFDQVTSELGRTYGALLQDLALASDEARRHGREVRTFSEAFDFLVDREVLNLPGANVRGTLFVEDTTHTAPWPTVALRNSVTDALFRAETFLDGSFSFFDVPAGTYTIEADRFLPIADPIIVTEGVSLTGLQIVAQSGETLSGRITNASGRAVANALVQVADALGREFLTSTDAYGRYLVEGLAPGAASIDVRVSSFVPIDDAALTLTGGANVRDFALSAGGTISGRVVSPTGAPVPSAELVAYMVDGTVYQSITAAFDGRFNLSGLPSGTYKLVANGAGFGAGLMGDVRVTSGTTTPVSNVSLTQGGAINGAVTDAETGLPIQGAQFSFTALGQNSGVITSAAGSYSVEAVTPGTISALISAPGYIPKIATIELGAGENIAVNAALRPLGKIEGTVLAGGGGAAGLELKLFPLSGPLSEPITAVTGEGGAFSFYGLPDGRYAVSLSGEDTSVAREVFLLDAADNSHAITLDLEAAEVTGIVRDPSGAPLESQTVSLLRGGRVIDTVSTDVEGRYRFFVFQGGQVDLIAAGESVGLVGRSDIDVTLGQAVSGMDLIAFGSPLTINVDAASNGADVADARVVLRSTSDALDAVTFGGFTNAAGQLVVPSLAPGEYEVFVTRSGFITERQTFTVGSAGAETTVLLEPGKVIAGTVRSSNGVPIQGAQVTILDRETLDTFTTYTDLDGNYTGNTLPAGSYDVLISDGKLLPSVISGLVVDGSAVRADATLATSETSLSGRVIDRKGVPLAGVIVDLLGPGDVPLISAVTDADGEYTLHNLPSGDAVRIGVAPRGYTGVVTSLTLPASGSGYQDLTVGEAVALGIKAAPSDGVAPTPSLFGVASLLDGRNLNTPGARFDGILNDYVNTVPPPSPVGFDGVDYRFVFPEFDVDCPEQLAAYKKAVNSGRQLNLAYQGWEIEFQNLNDANTADMAYLVETAEMLFRDMLNLADGIIGFKGALENFYKKGHTIPEQAKRNIEESVLAFEDAVSSGKKLFKGGFSKDTIKNLYNDINDATDAFKGAVGAFTDVDFKTGEIKLGGDYDKAARFGMPFANDLQNIVDGLKDLEARASEFATKAQESRGLDYLEAQNYYADKLKEHQQNRLELERLIGEGCGSPGPDPEDPDDKNPEDEEEVPSVGSRDPNDILGPKGFGPQNFIATDQRLDYTIRFENISTATAAAQRVFITQQLDADVDPSTFELGSFGFGGMTFQVPAGHDFYGARLDVTEEFGVYVDIEASLNVFTGLLTWTFTTIDPETLDLTADPLAGFLPPNLFSPEGEGFVSYSINASEGSASGTVIDAQATIVFDQNEPIDTPAIFHTLDAGKPSSSIDALPAVQTAPNIVLNFNSSDEANGSGLHSFDVYVSTNGGAYELFLNDFSGSSAIFRGENGQTYSFATVAKDNVGNTEILPLVPDATTATDFKIIPFDAKKKLASFLDANGDRVTIKLKGPGSGGLILDDPDGDGQGNIDTLVLDGTTSASKLSVSVKKGGGGDGLSPIARVQVDGLLGVFTAKNSDLVIEGFTATGAVKSISVRDLAASTQFGVPRIEVGGTSADSLKITAGRLGEGFSISTAGKLSSLKATEIADGAITAESLGKLAVKSGTMNADLAIAGAVGSVSIKGSVEASLWSAGSFASIKVSGGDFDTDVETPGAIGKLSVTGGDISGEIVAGRFGAISIKSGDLTGTLVANDSAESLGKTKALKSLKIAGGDLAGDVHLNGEAGGISVQTAKGGLGGSIEDARILASRIASLIVGKDLSDSMIIAGANLGSDRALGGLGSAADRFGSGEIGKVQVKGDMTAAILAAGLASTDAILGNGDDSIVDSASSRIASIIVQGTVSTDNYFAAGAIAKQPRFSGAKIDPATDGRFLVG